MAAPSALPTICLCLLVISALVVHEAQAQLRPDFYDRICPQALPIIKGVVQLAVAKEPRMGASLLRLHFHDCFVQGCDGSVLLDDAPGIASEKNAQPNNNSLRGFDVVDEIKRAVDWACYGSVVSCADILAVAARDSVAALGGPSYQVLLGRRDARTASPDLANKNIPAPFLDFSGLLSGFQSQGLNLQDLIALYGAHTIGFARCVNFRSRIYNEANIDSGFAASLQKQCPSIGGDNNLAGLDDSTPTRFDINYYQGLVQKKGLLHSDQQLFKGDGSASDGIVQYYIRNPNAFWADFGASMVKMGNISPLTGTDGEIRKNCRVVN